MIQRLLPYFLLVWFGGVVVFIFFPWPHRVPNNARRFECQSNLKRIGIAIQQYRQDHDDHLPLRKWVDPIAAYAQTDLVFQCPETTATPGTSDYFLNSRFLKKWLGDIEEPAKNILMGDGQDDAPLGMTLSLFPSAWRKDEKSPAFRHLETANYLFVDGHVKALKVNKIGADFMVVN